MRHLAILGMTMVAIGAVSACSDEDGGGAMTAVGGTAGMGGTVGTGGAAGTGGSAGSPSSGGASGSAGNPVPPTPALPSDAPTVVCPMQINGSLDTSDRSQTGRHSRIAPVAACGMTKGFPGNAADPSNPHLYDVYRFANPTAAPVCFNFTLTYGASVEGGLDAGPDAASPDAGAGSGLDAGVDAGADAGVAAPGAAVADRYLTAYGTFYPTDLSLGHLGDVGDRLTSPQTMGITVPANGTIDVVVYAIAVAPAGVGAYTLSCATQ